ncbi:hypothetical protein ALP29_200626 [Pseudomonas syringae pv. avii]|uniref:Uncharacterized protein n=1 Tax=Pseudomonas syringae pv. avii TaxID=663959 RepID=A0A3M5VB26_PSESX|nr:hypothetical protein ALP29_200626 [Pseudomonas syringae pv. avii]
MNGHDKNDLVDIGRYAGQIDLEHFVVAIASTGTVVAGMLDGAISTF